MGSLPTYQQLKNEIPLPAPLSAFVKKSRQTIRTILNGEDSRLLLIVGPCSVHDIASTKEYAIKLKALADEVSSEFFIALRTYFEKPRTSSGWKGFLYDPTLDGSHQIQNGLKWTRQLLIDLAAIRIPTATEFLDPLTTHYYEDLISWGSIGARTSSSQPHRLLASGLSMPVGFKNGIAGDISAAIHGVEVASQPQIFIGLNEHGGASIQRSEGNKDCHIVLRGGKQHPNYDPESVAKALSQIDKIDLPSRLMIDCSHQNSGKQHENQIPVFQSVMQQVMNGNSSIRGMMLESYLHAGNQHLSFNQAPLKYGVSITDSCLDFSSTRELIEWASTQISQI